MIPSRKQWANWSLPSKLTAVGTLVGCLSFLFYLAEKTYYILTSLPADREGTYLVQEYFPSIVELQIEDDANRAFENTLEGVEVIIAATPILSIMAADIEKHLEIRGASVSVINAEVPEGERCASDDSIWYSDSKKLSSAEEVQRAIGYNIPLVKKNETFTDVFVLLCN